MLRRQFLGHTLPSLLVGHSRLRSQSKRPPNVVLLIARRWRGQALPFAGDDYIDASNLLRLRAGSTWLRRAYSANPSAEPGKAAILTGRYPHMTGVIGNDDALAVDEPALAGWLANVGYTTAHVGPGPLDFWGPAGNIGEAVDFIHESWNRPFFLTIEFELTPKAGWDRRETEFRMPQNVPAARAAELQRAWRRYYSGCERVDEELGQVLETLEETGATGQSMIVFTADRGELLGAHGLTGDGEPYEEAVRVPLLIRYRNRLARGTIETPVSTVDIAPTILALAGARVPMEVQGRDLSEWLSGGGGERPETVYSQGRLGTEREWRMVVRGFDKLVVDRNLQVTHLYNLAQDPHELENLADDKSSRRRHDEMLAILEHSMRRARDKILPSGLRLRD